MFKTSQSQFTKFTGRTLHLSMLVIRHLSFLSIFLHVEAIQFLIFLFPPVAEYPMWPSENENRLDIMSCLIKKKYNKYINPFTKWVSWSVYSSKQVQIKMVLLNLEHLYNVHLEHILHIFMIFFYLLFHYLYKEITQIYYAMTINLTPTRCIYTLFLKINKDIIFCTANDNPCHTAHRAMLYQYYKDQDKNKH